MYNRVRYISVLILYLIVNGSEAATLSMICKNPRREYLVVFNDFSRSFIAKAEEGDTPYRVDSIRRVGESYTVKGVTIFGGPSFSALIGDGQQFIQFFDSRKLHQTDYCRKAS